MNRADRVGIALDLHPVWPVGDGHADEDAARIADGVQNRWFLDPVFTGAYPADILEHYAAAKVAPEIPGEDLELLKTFPPDFLGVNYYFPVRVRPQRKVPVLGFESVVPSDREQTAMGWEVNPGALRELLLRLRTDYRDPVLFVTENGAAYDDQPDGEGRVQDDRRIAYLESHLHEARRAIEDGVRLQGYYVWSLMDNFEWAMGYSKRFGIVSVDYHTQRRTWKASATWYQRVVASNGAEL